MLFLFCEVYAFFSCIIAVHPLTVCNGSWIFSNAYIFLFDKTLQKTNSNLKKAKRRTHIISMQFIKNASFKAQSQYFAKKIGLFHPRGHYSSIGQCYAWFTGLTRSNAALPRDDFDRIRVMEFGDEILRCMFRWNKRVAYKGIKQIMNNNR